MNEVNSYINTPPPRAIVSEAVIVGLNIALITPIALLALRRIRLSTYVIMQGLAVLSDKAVYSRDFYDSIGFNWDAHRIYKESGENMQPIDAYIEAAEISGKSLERIRGAPFRAAVIRGRYFRHVKSNHGYMVTLEEVYRTEKIGTYIRDGGDLPMLPGLA